MATDSNERQQEHEGLRETLKQVGYQNEMMLRWVNGAVISVNREGKVIQANEVALSSLGWKEKEFMGCRIHETIHHSQDDGSEYPWEFCPVFAAIEDGSSHHVDGDVFWKKDGSSFSADYIVCASRDEDNNITGAILTFRNITEQRLQESKRIHNMKLLAVGELSAGIAHEINTPVQFIGANVAFLHESLQDILDLLTVYQKLVDRVKDDESLSDIIQEIAEQEDVTDIDYLADEAPKAFEQTIDGIERVAKLIQGLKGFAHSGAGEQKAPSDINQIISNALIVSKNAYKYVAELETELTTLPLVSVFPGDIGQVIVNLIVNAAQAIEEKRKDNDPLGQILIKTFEEAGSVCITIEDTGGGIPEAVRERVFDPFFTTKEVGKGSGQGLAISHTLVHERHGGELSFNSVEGEGSTFLLRLPLEL